MSAIYIGVMTGTSMDGVDIVATSFEPLTLHATLTVPFDPELRDELMALTLPDDNEIDRMGKADVALAQMIGQGVNQLIEMNGLDRSRIKAIGSHGQTIRHRPEYGFTLQIGDPNIITEITQLPVISDFRRRDMAAGGQGAPLVPAFHQALFQHDSIHRVILNLGGIANVSMLPANNPNAVYGFDTGPANILMDAWCQRHTGNAYDENGDWAAYGQPIRSLLDRLQNHEFFAKEPPKSTGREDFNLEWLDDQISDWRNDLDYDELEDTPENVQATLMKLTTRAIKKAIYRSKDLMPTGEVYVCGGGAYNSHLLEQLRWRLRKHNWSVQTTDALGLAPTWVEATAFAWLAMRFIQQLSGNLATVTGASGDRILGTITAV
ncbi:MULTISPECIES: anhydro-N-acetylmuramic acid kinase [Acinetobacter]|uniref:Anhydro-N-acetylmuramic acid kinase n=3 Tax=Acinetobacter haemolyticus TaxID=29430 RepID=A0A380UDI5_ACIHA|nr:MULTISPECIES: anhydro-N-acetylmuramic acid kinase [Acinetobacter]EEH68844.1 anhydro-N-acetylmuramic acid kinase [Acinetobacter sp. ATCC 27244]EFF84162.1 anhydro-N-acetylmuramic acid kinase [Acinetobacter haemolyticus ATCC 19194]ENW18386.1 anhydro-N-acetylmuramic acid kinase [Acinetobacter haemolyticus NIPH 261]ENW21326.1 anhydro-N-acetylmuramic acid kinase [Acinetobacter haemolyticus CIP 64.3 = MTCC 9819]EPR88443.1 Anhydro-N-acetylmuramic acid kinase [Acinetobacter haemolyticus CIP 64.3 = M